MSVIKNVQITRTMLGKEDHRMFTCWLYLTGDGWGIGYGGYTLDNWNAQLQKRVVTENGFQAIQGIMEALDVGSWEELKGKFIRVELTDEFGTVTKVGHLLKDKWFSFKEHFSGVR